MVVSMQASFPLIPRTSPSLSALYITVHNTFLFTFLFSAYFFYSRRRTLALYCLGNIGCNIMNIPFFRGLIVALIEQSCFFLNISVTFIRLIIPGRQVKPFFERRKWVQLFSTTESCPRIPDTVDKQLKRKGGRLSPTWVGTGYPSSLSI